MTMVTETHTPTGEWYNENELRAYPFADACGTDLIQFVQRDADAVKIRFRKTERS